MAALHTIQGHVQLRWRDWMRGRAAEYAKELGELGGEEDKASRYREE